MPPAASKTASKYAWKSLRLRRRPVTRRRPAKNPYLAAMKKSNRRTFIGKGAVAAGAGLSTGTAIGTTPPAERPPIVHHVFFWLKNPASTEDRDKLVAGLKPLAGIPLIKELYV